MSVVVPDDADLIRQMPSSVLYQLEEAGRLATRFLDDRVIAWTDEGWAQRRIAEELGCSHVAVGNRQRRLGIESSQPKRPSGNPLTTSEPEPETEIVDAEPVPDSPKPRSTAGPSPQQKAREVRKQFTADIRALVRESRRLAEAAPRVYASATDDESGRWLADAESAVANLQAIRSTLIHPKGDRA